MLSKNYKNWISVEDEKRCVDCEELHGKVYKIQEVPNPKPPIHPWCRCVIQVLEALEAGLATGNGKNGADYWLAYFSQLPPYYISLEDARKAGWKSSKGNLASVAPNMMLKKGYLSKR